MKRFLCVAMILLVVLSTLSMLEFLVKATCDGVWNPKANMPTPRSGVAAVAFNGKIYVIGGINQSGGGISRPTDIVEIYDPTTDSWTTGTPMPTPKGKVGAAVIGNKIYVVGYTDNRTFRYDPLSDEWTERAQVPVDNFPVFGIGAIGGKMYVARGSMEYPSGTYWTYSYDPTTDTWTSKAPLPYPRSIASFAQLGGKFYAIGGGEWVDHTHVHTSRVDAYDPAADSWELNAIPNMPTGLTHFESDTPVVNGKIYVMGGWNGYTAVSTVYAYNSTTDSWETCTPMPTPRFASGTAVVNGKIYVIGGERGGMGGQLQSANEEFTPPGWTPSLITAHVDIDPDTLNLKSEGEWITAYIELPEDYDVDDVDVSSILLGNTIPVDVDAPVDIGDYDDDGVPDLMVKFDRAAVIDHVKSLIDWSNPVRSKPYTYEVSLTETGSLADGSSFGGSDTIRTLQFLKGNPEPL